MSTNLKTRVWISNNKKYTFPEQTLPAIQNKANIAICFSGGGTRAMTCAMGQLRALHSINALSKVRYISCVSGGSWASTIYTYYKGGALNDNDLLGPVTKTKDVTQQHIDNGTRPSRLAHRANSGFMHNFDGWITDKIWYGYYLDETWIFAVGQTYLEYFGIFNTKNAESHRDRFKYFSYDDATVNEIIACNPGLDKSQFLTANPDRPFLVVNSSILPNSSATAENIISFEYTPLTIGRPFRYKSPLSNQYYGGGFIEPFAFRANAPSQSGSGGISATCSVGSESVVKESAWKTSMRKLFSWLVGEPITPKEEATQPLATPGKMGSAGWVTVSGQDRAQSITDATGTSSAAFAQIAASWWLSGMDPQTNYWPIDAAVSDKASTTLFGDGGLVDNYGIISMIQRGVEHIMVFINTTEKLDVHYIPSFIQDPTGHCDQSLIALFGFSNPNWSYTYPNNQVFPQADCEVVLKALQARKAKGEPLITTTTHKTVSNDVWGVEAGTNAISITWCYLDRSTNWENKLPGNIAQQIQNGNASSPTGDFQLFPNYATFDQNELDSIYLTQKQIVLLSDFCCNVLLEDNQKTIQTALENAIPGFKVDDSEETKTE